MGLIGKIIEAQGRSGVRTYNQLRFTLTILAPVFVFLGIAGFFGLGRVHVNWKIVTGIGTIIFCIFGILLGVFLGYLWLTIFREKRYYFEQDR
jgi:hypothetical protein